MKIYNTMTREKEEFVPINEGKANIYVCGPTVYDFFHLGNARPLVVFDCLRRYLEYIGYKVNFVQNFTDVDDKIINKAREEGITANEVSINYIKEYFQDAKALNVREASLHPKVTENMSDIIAFIEKLITKGFAYEVDGDVYYKTRAFSEYGKLSHQNIDELEAGVRINIEEKKHDPLDFALWKARKEPDEIAWESPWGLGRPGWHIECSAMAQKFLGDTIDIHAGGRDLCFPHHENEIAQSEACTGRPFARYWMHNGYITMNKEKVSKSKGNFFTVRELLEEFDGETLRFFLLQGHYRNPIEFSKELIYQAKAGLDRIRRAKENLQYIIENGHEGEVSEDCINQLNKRIDSFKMHMEDDLNTADAITDIFEMVTDINSQLEKNGKEYARLALSKLQEVSNILGFLQGEGTEEIPENVKILAGERQEARKNKDFKRADEIRDEVLKLGYEIKDTPEGMQIVKA